jgi:hypothetical protein
MKDRRSLPPYEDELSLALLRSAEQDEPSAAAYSKAAAALGVSAAVGLGVSLPVQAALASNGLSTSALARWSGSLFAKAVLVGVSSALLIAGGVALLRHQSSARARAPLALRMDSALPGGPAAKRGLSLPAQAPALAQVVPTSTPQLSPPASALSAAVTASLVAAAAPALPPAAAVAPKLALAQSAASSQSVARAARASSLPEQVVSLDRARVALNSGDAGAALAEIAHYRSAWPRGVFLTEASVLEIEALAKRGEVVLAGMRAQAFVTAHPDCPQAERLRALIPSEARQSAR